MWSFPFFILAISYQFFFMWVTYKDQFSELKGFQCKFQLDTYTKFNVCKTLIDARCINIQSLRCNVVDLRNLNLMSVIRRLWTSYLRRI